MKRNIRIIVGLALLLFVMSTLSCTKQDEWLNAKHYSAIVTPSTLKDYQALMENATVIHNAFSIYGLTGADNYYLTDAAYNSSTEVERNGYIWSSKIWINGASTDWVSFYKIVEYANIIIDGLDKEPLTDVNVNNVRGQAFFYRAICFYNLAQLFCKPYDKTTSSADLGLPVRISPDVNIIYQRASVEETYQQMIGDAKSAITLLQTAQINNHRPGTAAANALLAKIYLCMEDYNGARQFATEALKINNTLLDFNGTYPSLSLTYRFPANALSHPEILFYAQGSNYGNVMAYDGSLGMASNDLYNQYQTNDLRKTLFYVASGTGYKYRGTYTGLNNDFSGIANNEVYLIRAECNARLHDVPAALNDLNTLLKMRYKTGTFTNYVLTDEEAALRLILTERRKELPFVGNLRWEDLRRLNKDPRFKTILTRTIAGVTYSLEPGSNKYVLPIPDNEIQLSGIQQNPR